MIKLSRSKLELLLKKEFDEHRKNGTAHYLITREGIDAIPYMHQHIDKWRNTFTGIQYRHPVTDFLIFGAVDDIWVDLMWQL